MCPSPPLELRLVERYHRLVAEHLGPNSEVAAGLRALPGTGTAFACTQAAWRFYANPAVTRTALAAPLVACGQQMAPELDRFALVALDWSRLNYDRHTRKRDRLELNGFTLGYIAQTALLLSDRDGTPLTALALSLWTSDGTYTTRTNEVFDDPTHLDEATETMTAIEAMGLARPVVYLIDREGDSAGHMRAWVGAQQRFVVRATMSPTVEVDGVRMAMREVVAGIELRPGATIDLAAGVIGQQFVGEGRVRIRRPAVECRRKGQPKQRRVAGEPIELRVIVSQVRAPDEQIVGEWVLLTNVEPEVAAEQIARWYVWRWKIEQLHKLLKREGQHIEQWQQRTGEGIFKRLLVAVMACVVVWQVARAQGQQAEATRQLLVRLSGRQMRRERPWTEPALLAGIWVLLAMLDALEQYDIDELRKMARSITMGMVRYDSS